MGHYSLFTKRATVITGLTKSRRVELAGGLRALGLEPHHASDIEATLNDERGAFEGRCFKALIPKTSSSEATLEVWMTTSTGAVGGLIKDSAVPGTLEMELYYSQHRSAAEAPTPEAPVVEPEAAVDTKNFITDFGDGDRSITNEAGEVVMTLPRYGVWADDSNKGKMQVVDTSDDLAELMRKYGIKSNQIYDLKGNRIEMGGKP